MPKGQKTTLLYANLRKEMAFRGYSIRSLAKQMGLSEGALRKKLNGTSRFYLDETSRISAFLDKPVDELFVN